MTNMGFARVHGAQTLGLTSHIVDVEVDISKGLHTFSIVGLPDKGVEEARDRVGSALKNSNFPSPKHSNQKVVVSLAPADIKKEGPLFDLPISLGYLLAKEEITFNPAKKLFVGELSLDGTLRPIKGALLIALAARKSGMSEIYVPTANAAEASLVGGINVYPVKTLEEVAAHLDTGGKSNEESSKQIQAVRQKKISRPQTEAPNDFSHIKGQESAKRAMLIAAAGGHNIGLHGPPGTGKTMLAKAFTSILPTLDYLALIEVTGIHSVTGHSKNSIVTEPPFRAPHHTSSYVSVVGGGSTPMPGEVTLAHRGVLFLDEFPEFDRRVVEALRQPLEDKQVSIARARGSETFPANFILIAAMNPCPCGFYGTEKQCTCTPGSLDKYRRKLSGPLVDRIDLWVQVDQIPHKNLLEKSKDSTLSSEVLKKKVATARNHQRIRYETYPHMHTNADLEAKTIESLITLSPESKAAMQAAAKNLDLSPRSFHRVMKVAQTIADLAGEPTIEPDHILEAVSYRRKAS